MGSLSEFPSEFGYAAAAYELLCAQPKSRAICCEDAKSAQIIANVAPFFGKTAYVLPDIRAESEADAEYYASELAQLGALLKEAADDENALIIAPTATAELKIQPASELCLEFGQKLDISELKDWLLKANFQPVSTVLDVGEFCINGDKIDIFAPGCEPLRVIFFCDEIESIREFDLASQLSSQQELESAKLLGVVGELFAAKQSLKEQFDIKNLQAAKKFSEFKPILSQQFFDANEGKKITLIASNESKLTGLRLADNVKIVKNNAYFCIKSADELIVSLNSAQAKKSKQRRIKLDINAICKGDYVVHERYGVGKFAGLELVKSAQFCNECLRLEYANNNVLLLPMTQLSALEPYSASCTPQLDSLGKSSFIKLKDRLKTKLFAIASHIAELAAKRVLVKAPKFSKPLDYELFKAAAGFELTRDQERAIAEIYEDFSRGYPMDRLVAADVGFGKTEVAMHAAFACCKAGFNCLFLAPTTLLSAQHFATLSARFEPFGIRVLRLDSTVKKAKFSKELAACEGACVIVGTHSLLGANIDKIGLFVVDEEHKFGVKQKEKLKELALSSHSLAMSATPIPRSLSSALSGLKSYSEITTPPNERIGVISRLAEQDDALIKEAILKELRRGGQVFYVHNRLASLEQKASYLKNLLPKIRLKTLSSASKAAEKEQILSEFLNGELDLLLSTSIVESGLDMPRANTIIIERSELFGIADLHQLRGRVGRASRQGFCYFLTSEELSESAKERLKSLASNSYLGAGAALAQQDLQLRGGGNLLGEEQSGHIEALGYGMYVRMLEDQLAQLAPNAQKESAQCELMLQISAYLSSEQIADDGVRLGFYRRLARAKTAYELGQIEDEFSDRFSRPEGPSALYFELMRLRLAACERGVSKISNFEANVKIEYSSGAHKVIKAPSAAALDILRACKGAL